MKKIIIILTVLTLAGCTFAPKYERVNFDMPASFAGGDNYTIKAGWWKQFDDETINTLVDEALKYNQDMKVAMARLNQSKASYGVAFANQLPTLDLNIDLGESWNNSKKVPRSPGGFSGTIGINWEIDLFGKYQAAADSAKAMMLASQAYIDAIKLSITGQVINNYFLIKSLELQLEIAKRTVATRQESVDVYSAKYEKGLISNLDLLQMISSLETAKTVLYQTSMALDSANSAQMILLGRQPKAIMADNVTGGLKLEEIVGNIVIPSGMPSDLLNRRPDIIQAEQMLLSTNADIGTARAAWFPTISLTGLVGIISPQLASLFSAGTGQYGYGASAGWNLFNFGKTGSNVDLAIAKKEEALANYEKTVGTAFRELRDALMAQIEYNRIIISQTVNRDKSLEANKLMKLRYDRGYSSILELLDTERQLLQAELDLAKARSNYLVSIVNVHLALGGSMEAGDNMTVTDNQTVAAQDNSSKN